MSGGFWKSGIKRTSKREEDKTYIDRYIETIEWVDIGNPDYLFAKYDFNDSEFSVEELLNTEYPKGVGLMNSDEFYYVKENCELFLADKGNYVGCEADNGETIYFNLRPKDDILKRMYLFKITDNKDYNATKAYMFLTSPDEPYLHNSNSMSFSKKSKDYKLKSFNTKFIKRK